MSNPSEFELLDMAVPYALDAVSDAERTDIEQRLAQVPGPIAAAFRAQVAEVRETMAALSATTVVTPPAALRDRVLAGSGEPVRELRWRKAVLAAAAVLAVAGGAFAAGWVLRPPATPPVAERVLTAPDMRAVSTTLRSGGTATVVYSRERGDGVLVLDGATAPPPGMGYQVWLMKDGVPVPAGTASRDSRTVMVADIGPASVLGLTVEPLDRSVGTPPGEMVARVSLP
ncbi:MULTISPECIES: anti-sigma factor [unclassified Mycolicibacterium]|uniref:anti-sigma factor n=1 Tax=unclassified Mycolicibacterium TaxID=2636767 RepID=UPI0012DFE3D4|nr:MULTISPECIES: anti-sigma factor [unclassified Mycolicibacterium]MUL81439.1 anti-sigma factor [Mycolicibacterium sp. CBMA 329]MUL87205.1 anti-sigma factor [Mycolicibacterium sp. CBMA 331]MUL98513.1 anti-sigma factor [Mycolicibacterium sp. CBMA 334]MUM25267.1 anti-sigma factor [Mycolicibacterium sp. CBMA 295]MUM37502.1 anti-sigma factor [Mycolicibacterium sp. CBMA 247]